MIAAAAPFSLRTIRPGETLKGACPPCHFPRNPCKHAVAFDSALASRTRREHPAVTAPRCTYRGIGSQNVVGKRFHVGLVKAPDRIAASQTESEIKACRNGRDVKRRTTTDLQDARFRGYWRFGHRNHHSKSDRSLARDRRSRASPFPVRCLACAA